MRFFQKTRLYALIDAIITSDIAPAGKELNISYGAFSFSWGRELQNYWREQWWYGMAGGGWLGAYSPYTIKQKIKKGLPYDRVTLFDTGKLYNSLYTRVERDGVVIGSDVSYIDDLLNRYGRRIFWLSESQKRELADEIIKKIKEQWLKKK